MKVRKLAVALALAGGLGSGLAQALGMGEGRILTNLNEPLRAQIELSEPGDLSADQIQVSLAPKSDFERAGLQRMDVLRDLKFELVETDGGYRINVTSEGPIREPFLNFLVEVTWPNGRLLREYSFLVDPPSHNPAQETVASDSDSADGRGRERKQEETEKSGRAVTASATPREYGPTGANDTLWGIAGDVTPSSDLSRHQVMLAIQEANPEAFANNNINQLRRGRVLRIPSEEVMRSRSKQEAFQQVKAQNQRHQQASQRRAQAAPAPSASTEDESAAQSQSSEGKTESGAASGSEGGEDELRILTAEGETDNGDGTMAGMGDGEGEERLAAALEELDRAERDREELSSRLKDLEKQLKTMKELIELKDDQLAEMEQKLAEAREKTQSSGDSAGTQETEVSENREVEVDAAVEIDTAVAADQQSGDADSGETDKGDGDDGDGSTELKKPEDEQSQGSPEVTDTTGTAAESKPEESSSDQSKPAEATPDESKAGDSSAKEEEVEAAAANGSGEQPDGGDGVGQPTPAKTQEQGAPSSLSEVFQKVINDPRYQIGAGVVGLGLLGLLWGLARRNAAREQAFYEQLRDVQETPEAPVEGEQVLDLGGSGDEAGTGADSEEGSPGKEDGEDALAEADVYLAYGRHEQAARHLEQAIATEPGRKDLRLKLLGIYAESGETEPFEKQYRELSDLGDEAAIQQADALRSQLDGAGEQEVSIEDLTEQLKTNGAATSTEGESSAEVESLEDEAFDFSALEDADDLLSESVDSDTGSASPESEGGQSAGVDDYSIDFDLGEADKPSPSQSGAPGHGESEPEGIPDTSQTEEDVADLGFSMEELELDESEAVPELDADLAEHDPEGTSSESREEPSAETDSAADEMDTDLTLDDLDIDMDMESGDSEPSGEATEAPAEATKEPSPDSDFDDSFLEELDAELDRVTGEEAESDEPAESATTASTDSGASSDELDDLSLDVSDEDLELAEEVAQEGVGEEPAAPQESTGPTEQAPADQLEEGLMDSELEDIGAEGELSDEELAALEGEQEQAPQAPQPQQKEEAQAMDTGNDTSSSGSSEEEFDFLEGTDEAGTKLDLARAYVEMGDADGARDILEEVAREGSDEQQQQAQRLLSEL